MVEILTEQICNETHEAEVLEFKDRRWEPSSQKKISFSTDHPELFDSRKRVFTNAVQQKITDMSN